MSKVDITVLKKLCAETSAGLVHCKKALEKAEGDYDKAREYLKDLGHSISAKKSDRKANEGVIIIKEHNNFVVMLVLGCETDFVARNEKFQSFAKKIVDIACKNKIKSKDDFLKFKTDSDSTVDDEIKSQVAIFKENIILSKYYAVQLNDDELVNYYVHNEYVHMIGKSGVVVVIKVDGNKDQKDKEILKDITKKLCIQVMCYSPQSVSVEGLDPKVVEEERSRFKEELAGKPADIIEKISIGKMQKFYRETVLLEQEFFEDPNINIKEYLESEGKELSAKIDIISYKKFTIGRDDE